MAEVNTKPTAASVAQYLAAISDTERRADCKVVAKIMRKITRQEPKMWGASMVGFGRYRYVYESGHGGEWFQTGFASRKSDLTIYLLAAGASQAKLLPRLGKHKMGKSCLYIRRLSDIDLEILESLISGSVVEIKRRYGLPSGELS